MANVATTVLIGGKVEIPLQTLAAKHWSDGSLLRIVETSDGLLLKEETPAPLRNVNFTFEELLAANKERLGLAPAYEGWRALEGVLSDDLVDSLEEKHRLRDEEQVCDQRKFEI